jgi:uncharacterized RDD family membrane protein YckC
MSEKCLSTWVIWYLIILFGITDMFMQQVCLGQLSEMRGIMYIILDLLSKLFFFYSLGNQTPNKRWFILYIFGTRIDHKRLLQHAVLEKNDGVKILVH